MKKRPIAKLESAADDSASSSSSSFSKKTQLGASGAVVGAIIGGPIGAIVGGILGGAFGAAAEISPRIDGEYSEKTISPPPDKPARAVSKRRKAKPRAQSKRIKTSSTRYRRRR